jgi:hypothetical protein
MPSDPRLHAALAALAHPIAEFRAIVVGYEQAHIAHGDGIALVFYDPPLHLASDIGPHKASNVDCAAIRIVPQPPDHGN